MNETLELKDGKNGFDLKINGVSMEAQSYTLKNSTSGVVELSVELQFLDSNTNIEIKKEMTSKKFTPKISLEISQTQTDELINQIEECVSQVCDKVLRDS